MYIAQNVGNKSEVVDSDNFQCLPTYVVASRKFFYSIYQLWSCFGYTLLFICLGCARSTCVYRNL